MLVRELIAELNKVDPELEVRTVHPLGNFVKIDTARVGSTGENLSKYDWESGIDAQPIFVIERSSKKSR